MNITTIIILSIVVIVCVCIIIWLILRRKGIKLRGGSSWKFDDAKKFINDLGKYTDGSRVNTDEEVTFENRIFEIAKSPEDIKMNYCNIVREYWNYKFDFIITIITCVGLEGIVMG